MSALSAMLKKEEEEGGTLGLSFSSLAGSTAAFKLNSFQRSHLH